MKHIDFSESYDALDLRLFDGEGGGAAGRDAGGGTGEAADAQQTAGDPEGLLENGGTGEAGENETPEERYDRLIASDPEMKAIYEKRFQRELGRRLKGARGMQTELEELRPIAALLKKSRGIEDNKALYRSLREDDELYAERAAKNGYTPEGQRHVDDVEDKLARFEAAEKTRLQNEYLDALRREIDTDILSKYPDVDADELMNNPTFMDLMRIPSISALHAYQVLNADELFSSVAAEGVRVGKQKAAEAQRARSARPAENGLGARPTGQVKPYDVSKLTRAEREELERQALRGGKVYL
ncbi:MAG: hypothetical protein IJV00_10250 [Clostridia bacterium]|nr:hypothetical protein [Clostridia bacterium]